MSRANDWRLGAIGLVLFVLSGCAARPAGHEAAVGADPAPDVRTGRIVSARPVAPQIEGARRGVLGALGAPAGTGASVTPATEFIVQERGGAIISVMQPGPTGLHPGQHVRILRGAVTRLAPLAPTS